MRPVGSAIMRTAWRIRLHHHEFVPGDGPVILASNHTGILDGPLLYSVVGRPVHALVKQEMFRGSVGRGLRWIGQIPVDRLACDPAAVKDCLAVLHRGGVVAVYPEGTRGVGDFVQVKPGAAYLALCTGAPIVPVAGFGVAGPAGTGGLPPMRSTIDIVFGRPISTEPIPWPRRRDVVRKHADAVGMLLREHRRRAYALIGRPLPGGESEQPGPEQQEVRQPTHPE